MRVLSFLTLSLFPCIAFDEFSFLNADGPVTLDVDPTASHVYANDQVFLANDNDPIHPTKNLATSKLLTKEQDYALLAQYGSNDFADPFPEFGKCSTDERELRHDIDVYIVIDICPTSDECKVLRTWSLQLQEYVRNQYDTACRLHFIADPDCRHLFNIIRDINWQVNNPDMAFLSAEEPWHPSFTAHPESLSYAVNLISRGRHWVKHYVDLEYKAKITEHFDFFVCGKDDRTCQPGTETSSGIVQLGVLTDLIKYSNLRIVKTFTCPTVRNSVPVEFYYQGKHHCSCRCPAGYELNDPSEGIRRCIKKKKKCQCRWLRQCFEYKVTSEWRDKPCAITDWHSRDGLVPIPMVLDNYVGFKVNPSDYDDNGIGKSLNQPCVQLSIRDIDNDDALTFTVDYSWKYFQENRYFIFNSIEITHAGRYELTLKAFDYGNIPAVCSTIIAVVDDHPPYSSNCEKCPEGKSFGDETYRQTKLAPFTEENVEAAKDLIDDYQLWYGGRSNDQCGEDPTTDCANFPEQFFLQRFGTGTVAERRSEIDISMADDCFILTSEDLAFLSTEFWKDTSAHALRPQAQFCTKCCHLDHTFSEYYYRYRCRRDNPLTKLCQKGEGCDFDQCLRAQATTFFKSKSSIKNSPTTYVDNTEEIIENFREQGYNSVDEIHLIYDCGPGTTTVYGACDNIHDFKNMFDLQVEFVSSYVAQLFGKTSIGDTSEFIRWRYRIQGSNQYQYYNPAQGLEYNFNSHFSRYITFQALSACGVICTISFTVYVHIPSPIEVCESFDAYSFYQTSNYKSTSQFCNYPQADWAELTFDWNPQHVIEKRTSSRHLSYKFVRMECDVCLDDTTPVTNLVVWESSTRFLDRYAILLSEYPTQASTHLTWKCRITYEDYKNVSQTTECMHEMDFYDCDPPEIDCAWSECQVNCTDDKQLPYQICGGNQIYKSDEDTTTHSSLGRSCCSACNTVSGDTTCASMFNYIDENSLYYCKVGSHKELQGHGNYNQRKICDYDEYRVSNTQCAKCPDMMTAKGTDQNSVDDCYCELPGDVQIGSLCYPGNECIQQGYLSTSNFIQLASVSGKPLKEFNEGGSDTRYVSSLDSDTNPCTTSQYGASFGEFNGAGGGGKPLHDIQFSVLYNAYKLSALSVDMLDFGDWNPYGYDTCEAFFSAIPATAATQDSYKAIGTNNKESFGDACAAGGVNWHGQENLALAGNNIEGGQISVVTKFGSTEANYFGDPNTAFSKICYSVDFTCNTLTGAGNCYAIPEKAPAVAANTFTHVKDYAGCVALCKSKGYCWGVSFTGGVSGVALLAESGEAGAQCTLFFGTFEHKDCDEAAETQCAVSNAPQVGDNDPEDPTQSAYLAKEDYCHTVTDATPNVEIYLHQYSLKACRGLCDASNCEAFEYHAHDHPSERKCIIINDATGITAGTCDDIVTYERKVINPMSFVVSTSIPESSLMMLGLLVAAIALFVGKTIMQKQQVEPVDDNYAPLI